MSDKVKILHVIGKRPKGGIGTFLINMHSNIDTSKVQFDYLINASTLEGEFDRKVKALGGNVFVLPELRYKNTIKYLRNLNNFFKEHNDYKAIHVHSPNIGIFNFIMAKKYGIKYRIIHSHNTKYSDNKINSIRNFFMQLPIKKLANIYFACSKKAGEFLFGANNVEKGNVYIAKNAVNAEKFRYNEDVRKRIRRELAIEEKFVLGHVGRFNTQKNHNFLIDIFYEVHKLNNKSILLLIGDGEFEKQIKQKVKKLNLEKSVFFFGVRNDVSDLMQAFDVFLLPSLFEGLPLVGIEAQAAGLKCIMSDTITDEIKIIDLVEFVSLSKSPKEWAQKILKYANGYNRKNVYKEILNAGYEVKYAAKKLQDYYLNLK
ncbi:MAG: hypothetical protein PWR14_514 [Thermosediminibacterales bacterium]|nr:hypothetical protein [Thermosediminibacterales bacterium]